MLLKQNEIRKIKKTKLFILDMDGTVYLGDKVFPYAPEFVSRVRESEKKIVFFTNNSSKTPFDYYQKLTRMGFEVSPEDIITSGDVAAEYLLVNHKNEPVYLVGTPSLEKSFSDRGIELSEKAGIVISAFDTSLTYKKLETACRLIAGGAVFYSTHPDFNCPAENGFIPDCGSINALITASTGKTPKYFGKPYAETASFISAKFGIPFDKTIIVGDRLYTDIALGKSNGIFSILVLTGETKTRDISGDCQPDLIMENIGILNDYIKYA